MSKVRDTTAMRIRERRIALGMTQEDLATACGYNGRSSINKIEMDARNVPLEKLVLISEALHVNPSYLMGWDNESFGEYLDRQGAKSEIERLFNLLSPENQKLVTRMIESLAEKQTAPQED